MEKIKIRVREEIVRCSDCGNINNLYYLSDFSYGEKLIIYDEGRKYAFINFFEDNIYDEFTELVHEIVAENGGSIEDIKINDLFEMTCDRIEECLITFKQDKRKCNYCDSYVFEARLLEPEKLADIEVPIVTHEIWERLDNIKKREMIEEFLKNKKII